MAAAERDAHALTLLEPFFSARFENFGCAERGMHVDAAGAARCRPCAIWAGTVWTGDDPVAEAIALADDRGGTYVFGTAASEPWPNRRWVKPGVGLHRTDGPAVEGGGVSAYFVNGVLTRNDGPALTWPDGEAWFVNGRLHRVGGPATTDVRTRVWYRNGARHRDDGPAAITPGHARWILDGDTVTRDHAWRHWVARSGYVSADNIPAIDSLPIGPRDTIGEDLTFQEPDPVVVQLAAMLYPDPVPSAAPNTRHDTTSEPPIQPATIADPLWPGHHLRAGVSCEPVSYDATAFRRSLHQALQHGALLPEVHCESSATGLFDVAPYVSAELLLDPAVNAGGVPTPYWLTRAATRTQSRNHGRAWTRACLDHIEYFTSLHTHAHALAAALADGCGYASLGMITPPTLEAAIEDAYVKAAQWISVGVDDALARAWASGIVMATGGPCMPFSPNAGHMGYRRYGLRRDDVRARDYYLRALEDLRVRRDATRFMNFVRLVHLPNV